MLVASLLAACASIVRPSDAEVADSDIPDVFDDRVGIGDAHSPNDAETATTDAAGSPVSPLVMVRFRSQSMTGQTLLGVNLLPQDLSEEEYRESNVDGCTIRYQRVPGRRVSAGVVRWRVRALSGSAPITASNAYLTSLLPHELPNEGDVVGVTASGGVDFPAFDVGGRWPAALAMVSPPDSPTELPLPASGPLEFRWAPVADPTLYARLFIYWDEVNDVVCVVPASAGRLVMSQQILDRMRGALQSRSGRLSGVRLVDAQVGARRLQLRLEEAAFQFRLR